MSAGNPVSSTEISRLSETLRINEIFLSIQGESSRTGLPTSFIRLTGCPLRCHYCDTAYAFHNGNMMSIEDILDEIAGHDTPYVTVTGGEPLAQRSCTTLLELLCDRGYKVSIETSGAIDISGIDHRVMKVMDIKTPGSGESDKNNYNNLKFINRSDEIKFVICDHEDYEWSKKLIQSEMLQEKCMVLLSPEHGSLQASQLANWILEDNLNVRLQVQLHKYLWGDIPGK